jgi:hypothetical protein
MPDTFTSTLRVLSDTTQMISQTLRVMEMGVYAVNVSEWRNMVLLGILVGLVIASFVALIVRGR